MKKTYILRALPILAGAAVGYAYYYFIGCQSGTCAITSNPYISTAYGAFTGLIFAIPTKKKEKKTIKVDNNE